MERSLDRQEVKRWDPLNDRISIDYKSTLGKGNYGVVYRGYSKTKDALIAIKLVRESELSTREVETLKALSSLNHPNIMGFYGEIHLNQNIFLLLEYCNGGTLTQLIRHQIPELKVLKLFRQLVEGMCYLNAKQKMHRDLKPDNILIGPEEDIKISDFGLSQNTNSIFVTGKRGTPIYAAPQVYLLHNNQTYAYNCDVWSAGLILHEMLMGERFFGDIQKYPQLKDEWIQCERGLKIVELKPHLHPLWKYFLNFMLQFDPQKRPTFHQVLQQIKKVYSHMERQIMGKLDMLKELQLVQADRFIRFQMAKYNVLVDLCENFTSQNIRLRNEYKYVCMLLCLLRFTHFARNFIRQLRNRRIRIDSKELLPSKDSPQMEMLCDSSRFVLQRRYDFYSAQIKNTLVAILQDKYRKRPESQVIMEKMREMVEVIDLIGSNQQPPDDEKIKDLLVQLITIIRSSSVFRQKFKEYSQVELQLYAHLLYAVRLQEIFPQADYSKVDPKAQLQVISGKGKEELMETIDKIHQQIDR